MSDRVEELYERVVSLETKVGTLDEKVSVGLDRVDESFAEMRDLVYDRTEKLNSRFNRLERKLDQFIDTQSKTNELTERRLIRLESA